MIIVTGAAGFIGSAIVARLNERGQKDILVVDHFEEGDLKTTKDIKKENLKGKKFVQYLDKKIFLERLTRDEIKADMDCLIHMGACSSTTLQDADYFEQNNFQYTLKLAEWALKHKIRFIYASSAATYGDGGFGYKDDEETIRRCQPLNLYGQSKQKFDLWALDHQVLHKMVGLKFFNVYGPNEYHKADMQSVAAKNYEKVIQEGEIKLFKSYKKEYKDGEQKRDFIYVKDAVEIVMFFIDHPRISGMFNVGTGMAQTWNDLAKGLFKAVNKPVRVEYMDMPLDLRPRYQYFTQADMTKLRKAGYLQPFMNLEEGIKDYVRYLKDHRYW